MEGFSLILMITLISWLIYRAASWALYNRLARKLQNRSLDSFITELGEQYEYKFMMGGLRRYKWKKHLLLVKATFDEDGCLCSLKIRPYSFFGFRIELIFT